MKRGETSLLLETHQCFQLGSNFCLGSQYTLKTPRRQLLWRPLMSQILLFSGILHLSEAFCLGAGGSGGEFAVWSKFHPHYNLYSSQIDHFLDEIYLLSNLHVK